MACVSCGAELTTGGCSNPSCPTRSLTPPAFKAVAPDAKARRIYELEEALRKYGFHFLDCAVWSDRDPTKPSDKVFIRACSCGLDAALRGGGG